VNQSKPNLGEPNHKLPLKRIKKRDEVSGKGGDYKERGEEKKAYRIKWKAPGAWGYFKRRRGRKDKNLLDPLKERST